MALGIHASARPFKSLHPSPTTHHSFSYNSHFSPKPEAQQQPPTSSPATAKKVLEEEKKSPNPMSGRSNETPSFFKVLSNVDYIKLLRLPPHFLRKYELTLPANVKLRVDDSGRRWNVRVERMDDGLFCFTNGWEKFAEDAALKFGEFLVFSLLAKSEMNVDIYETSCCKREIPLLQLNAQDADESGVKRGIRVRPSSGKRGGKARKRNCFMKEGNPLYFATYLRPYHRWTISLPRAFSRAANMKVKKQVRVKYVGKRRGLCVALSHRPPRPTIDLAKGWREFREANGLVVGKIYSFEFNPDDQVIYVNRVAS